MDAYSYENDPTAVVGRRVAAFLIDLLSAVVVGAVVLALRGLTKVITDDAGFAIEGPEGNIDEFDPSQLILEVGNDVFVVESMRSFWLGAGLFLLFLWALVQGLTGRTLGKWVTGVRTIASNGSNPSPIRSLVRTIPWAVVALIAWFIESRFDWDLPWRAAAVLGIGSILLLIESALALSTAGHRRFGDLFGRTFVVDQEFAGTGITIEDGSARTRTVGDEEADIDLREDSEPAPSRRDKKQAERDAEERLRAKQEADDKAAAAASAPAAKAAQPAKPMPVETPEPTTIEPNPERVSVPAAAAYGAGAAAAASSSRPSWPNLSDTAAADATDIASPTRQVADAGVTSPSPVSPTPVSPSPISPTPATSPAPIATPTAAPTPVAAQPSTAFPPTAFGAGPPADTGPPAVTAATPEPTTPQRITPEPDPTPLVEQETAAQPTQNASGEWEYEPQWDDDRETYILWDARRSEWLEWNNDANNWGPISQ